MQRHKRRAPPPPLPGTHSYLRYLDSWYWRGFSFQDYGVSRTCTTQLTAYHPDQVPVKYGSLLYYGWRFSRLIIAVTM